MPEHAHHGVLAGYGPPNRGTVHDVPPDYYQPFVGEAELRSVPRERRYPVTPLQGLLHEGSARPAGRAEDYHVHNPNPPFFTPIHAPVRLVGQMSTYESYRTNVRSTREMEDARE